MTQSPRPLSLHNKNILLGVSGGIAAYKSAEIIRRLKDIGADVRVVMTRGAQEFITPMTLQALSGNPVHTELLNAEAEAAMGHIEQARWADFIILAPATADLVARICHGRADDILTTLCLAADAPLAIAPAMNQAMWRDPSTQENIQKLKARNIAIWGPDEGIQACGDVGLGRMIQPEDIAERCAKQFTSGVLAGKKVCITAGPTREAIDPVRYISNHSSGKMGFALAQAAIEAGAEVTLICGSVNLKTPDHAQRIDIVSANDMLEASLQQLGNCDLFIGCAAVADYRPADIATQKIKKNAEQMSINLVKNPDIISAIAQHEKRPFTVGFAAETQDVLKYAQGKLERKNLDMIIANDVAAGDRGFNSDSNAVTIISKTKNIELPLTSKTQLARQIIQNIATEISQ